LTGSASRFGESAATLLGDLCLVWSGKMLRDSGISAEALARVQPRYDDMCVELAVGQFADLMNDACVLPTLDDVLDVLRRKSGNYTVRRPLEIGAVMAGCAAEVVEAVGVYGAAIGEAFQLRDDILGVFGTPSVTGKDVGTDLMEQKATSVVVAAHQLADARTRSQLTALMRSPALGTEDVERWQTLIASTGAVRWIEELIDRHMEQALECLDGVDIPPDVREALEDMAVACTERAA
ncbi:MAG: Polyprenyl synthetase, partial [Mycobacterium sp.]|nr:Polyprenyl synthetase [Mycobacterium sp.]